MRLYAALLAIVVIAYANAFGLGLALDGRHFVEADSRIREAAAANVQRIFETDYWWPASVDPLYRPATNLSFLVNYAVLGNGVHPAGYHAVNILLHALNVCLVFALALRLLRMQWPAFFAAAIWAVHPVGVEAVANVAGRADLLAAAGMLGALLVYITSPRRYWAILPLAALAVFAKETGAILAALMLLCDLAPGVRKGSTWRDRLPAYAAALAPLALYGWMRFRVLDALPWPLPGYPDNPLRGAGFLGARWTVVKLLGIDLGLLIWPARLVSDRAYAEILPASFADPLAWLALLVVLAVLGTVIVRRAADPVCFWAAGFFGLTLLPASNLVVLINATMAERFLYLPAIGFAVAVSALAFRLAPRRAIAGLSIAVALLAGRTLARNRDWDNEVTLMAHDSRVAPRSFRVHDVYGQFLYAADPRNLDQSIAELEKAWAILSPLPPERNVAPVPGALATYYMLKADRFTHGSPEEIQWRRKALDLAQRTDTILRVSEKSFDAGQAAHGKPVAPRRPSQILYALLGNAHSALGDYREAIAAYRYGRGIDPSWAELYDRAAMAYRSMSDPGGAARMELAKAFALGMTPPLLAGVERAYAEVPGGSCATARTGGVPLLNAGCPRLRDDLCPVLSEVAATFADARMPDRAASFSRIAGQYGCNRAR